MKKSKLTRIPTHLHAARFSRFEADDPVVKDIIAAQARARAAAEAILESYDLRMADPNNTRAANLRKAKVYAEKKLAEVLPAIDEQRKRTRAVIDEAEKDIARGLAEGATEWAFAQETRAHVRSLTEPQRAAFLGDCFNRGDRLAAAAVLGVPAYLSGLSEAAQRAYRLRYRQVFHPAESKRVAALSAAQEILDAGGTAFINSTMRLFDDREVSAAEQHERRVTEAEAI